MVILANGNIVVLEFKDYGVVHRAHVDQAAAYARDLHSYHAGNHMTAVVPVLVLTQSGAPRESRRNVTIVGPRDLATAVDSLIQVGHGAPIDPDTWISSDYAPLPTLVAAARTIFEHEPLPQIRRAQSAGIPEPAAAAVAGARAAPAALEQIPGVGEPRMHATYEALRAAGLRTI